MRRAGWRAGIDVEIVGSSFSRKGWMSTTVNSRARLDVQSSSVPPSTCLAQRLARYTTIPYIYQASTTTVTLPVPNSLKGKSGGTRSRCPHPNLSLPDEDDDDVYMMRANRTELPTAGQKSELTQASQATRRQARSETTYRSKKSLSQLRAPCRARTAPTLFTCQ